MKKKILFITHSTASGGGGEFDFELLLKHFSGKKLKYEVNALFPRGENSEYLHKYCTKYGYYRWGYLPSHYIYGIVNYFKYLYKLIFQIRDIKKFISKDKYDLCVVNVIVILWPALYLAFKKIKVVVFVRENLFPVFMRNVIYKIMCLAGMYAITNSKAAKLNYEMVTDCKNVAYLYPALGNIIENDYLDKTNTDYINNPASNDISSRFRFVNIGAINKLKNQKLIITALNKLKEYEIDLPHIMFIGSYDINDKYYQQLQSLIENYSLSSHITFTGKLSKRNVFSSLMNCSALIISSITEGMPISMIEALKFGKPVLSTKVGGVPEILSNNENGLLYSNDENSLAEAMFKIISDNKFYSNLIEQSYNTYIKYFNLDSSMAKTENIFDNLMGKSLKTISKNF